MADFGADVIKIEALKDGNELRKWRLIEDRTSFWWQVHLRNKRSLSLNLRQTDAQAIARTLMQEADALIEKFRPDTQEDGA